MHTRKNTAGSGDYVYLGTADDVKVTNDTRALMFSTLSVRVYTVIFRLGFVEYE